MISVFNDEGVDLAARSDFMVDVCDFRGGVTVSLLFAFVTLALFGESGFRSDTAGAAAETRVRLLVCRVRAVADVAVATAEVVLRFIVWTIDAFPVAGLLLTPTFPSGEVPTSA
jgi:hypothetical protein